MQVYEQFNIKGRTALVTGGRRPLRYDGTGTSQAGCRVAVLGRTPAKVEAMVETIRSEGGDAIGVAADVLSVEDMERARDEVLEAFGRIDILVNGAGGNHPDATTGPDKTFSIWISKLCVMSLISI